MDLIDSYIAETQKQIDFTALVGDTVSVHVRFQEEGGKERTQIFTGVVLKIQGKKSTRAFTVRKMSDGVGVEKTFPLASPTLQKVEIESRAKIRRARLFYLRELRGRAARLKTLIVASKKKQPEKQAAKQPEKQAAKQPEKKVEKKVAKQAEKKAEKKVVKQAEKKVTKQATKQTIKKTD